MHFAIALNQGFGGMAISEPARKLSDSETLFHVDCTSFEHQLARVGWLIGELTRGRKRAIATELKLSRSTLARYTCVSPAAWSDARGPVKLHTLARILAYLGIELEAALAAARAARTPEEMRYFARGVVRLVPPDGGSTH
jgi:hypothetical protein